MLVYSVFYGSYEFLFLFWLLAAILNSENPSRLGSPQSVKLSSGHLDLSKNELILILEDGNYIFFLISVCAHEPIVFYQIHFRRKFLPDFIMVLISVGHSWVIRYLSITCVTTKVKGYYLSNHSDPLLKRYFKYPNLGNAGVLGPSNIPLLFTRPW